MTISLAMKNEVLQVFDRMVSASLHTAYSATGGSELQAIGTPVYARKAIHWSPASNNVKLSSGTVMFDVYDGARVAWLGFWSFDGVFEGMLPNAGPLNPNNTLRAFQYTQTGTGFMDTAASTHGLAVGDFVVFWDASVYNQSNTLPAAFQTFPGTPYYVRDTPTTSSFRVSQVSGGAPFVPSSTGFGYFQRIVLQDYTEQGTFLVSSVSWSTSG